MCRRARRLLPCARTAVKGRRTEMTATDLLPAHDSVEAAIARVLDAEHAAREAVTEAGDTAAAMIEAARAEGRAITERTERRIRAVRATFEARTGADVAALDAVAIDAGVRHELTQDEIARVDAAVAALAARLTQGSP